MLLVHSIFVCSYKLYYVNSMLPTRPPKAHLRNHEMPFSSRGIRLSGTSAANDDGEGAAEYLRSA